MVKVRVNVVNCTPKAIMLLADETAVEYKGLIGIVPVGGGGTMRYGKPKSWWPGPAQRWYRVRPVDVDPPLKAGEPIPRKNGACLEFDILLPLGPGLIEYADMEWVLPIWYYMLEGEPVYGDDLQE
ncbi:MAG: hypothetical protein NTV86_13985, partial [Planctomycetota bacterium]|nr:hypothetical protein [Planctomycetota bacterium]